jgi:hypothetical protein
VYAQERAKENFPSQSSRTPKRGKTTPVPSNHRPLGASLPASETGQRLAALFPNGWDWIYSDPPSSDQKPNWETVKNYPLTPIELWSHHQNPDILIGIRPSATTCWGILDIDKHSKYHPAQNPEALQTICNTLEDIGITRTLINQSSHSGGLHLYIPLPELVSSYWLSITFKYHLEAAGIQIRSGQCELFPNPKRYIPKGQGFSHFNGIRMPMQPHTGFIPLDQDLNPLPWSLEDWLNAFDQAASHQDIPKLTQQIEEAKQNHKIRTHRNPHSIDTWRERIEQEKTQGWTGPGQTNEKLKIFGCEARVFLNMDSEQQIADYIQQTAQNTPGFYDHSNHTRDIAQRSREIAQWAIRYYWPLGAAPSRETGYHTPPTPIASFSYHQAKREAAQHRINQAISELAAQNQLPTTATARAKAIAQHAHISHQTLYKGTNLELWHPEHQNPLALPQDQPEPTAQQDITPLFKTNRKIVPIKRLQPLLNKRITHLSLYEGFVICNLILSTLEALALQGQRAFPTQEFPDGGGIGGELPTPTLQNWADLRKTLPPSMQERIAKAERIRQRKLDQEQQRRDRAIAKQHQQKLDLATRPQTPDELAAIEQEISQIFSTQRIIQGLDLPLPERPVEPRETPFQDSPIHPPFCPITTQFFEPQAIQDAPIIEIDGLPESNLDKAPLPTQTAHTHPHIPKNPSSLIALEQRPPTLAEQTEFERWYALAIAFNLVTHRRWEDREYWVYCNDQWETYSEISGTFTVRRLRQYLHLDPTPEPPKE